MAMRVPSGDHASEVGAGPGASGRRSGAPPGTAATSTAAPDAHAMRAESADQAATGPAPVGAAAIRRRGPPTRSSARSPP